VHQNSIMLRTRKRIFIHGGSVINGNIHRINKYSDCTSSSRSCKSTLGNSDIVSLQLGFMADPSILCHEYNVCARTAPARLRILGSIVRTRKRRRTRLDRRRSAAIEFSRGCIRDSLRFHSVFAHDGSASVFPWKALAFRKILARSPLLAAHVFSIICLI